MTDNVYVTVVQKSLKKYLPLFKLIVNSNKYFDVNTLNYIAVVNNGNIDVGVIGIKIVSEDIMEVQLYQAPKVCRLSILSIIESTIPFIQTLALTIKDVHYINMPIAYSFKLTSMFNNSFSKEEDKVIIPSKSILNLNIASVTSKKIIINSE